MNEMRPYILQETDWKNLKEDAFEVAVLPWGATEPHNYHLPYGTDNLETGKIAEISAGKAWKRNAKVMVLPTIPLGVQNPGQIELPFCLHTSPHTQKLIVFDIVKALYHQGIKKVLILNGHGGNDFKPMIREMQGDFAGLFLGLTEWFRIPEGVTFFAEPGDHAGAMETSVMQHLFPHLVRPLDEAGDGSTRGYKLKGLQDNVAWIPRHWAKISQDTGVGNPRESSPEKGKQCVETVTNIIADFLVELASADLDDIYE